MSVGFAATGGTVTQGGLFTAGSTAGTYRLIASNGSLADTSVVIVSAPLGSGPADRHSVRAGRALDHGLGPFCELGGVHHEHERGLP